VICQSDVSIRQISQIGPSRGASDTIDLRILISILTSSCVDVSGFKVTLEISIAEMR
jgi:hypothetical protein